MKQARFASFAAGLRTTMKRRGMTSKRLSELTGYHIGSIAAARYGHQLPLTETVAKLAEELDAPFLVTLAREARTRTCGFCERSFTQSDNSPAPTARFCSQQCRERYYHRQLSDKRKRTLPERLIAAHAQTRAHKQDLEAQRATAQRQADAIEAFCRACEWDGFCKDVECPLRDVSPLPLAKEAAA